MITQKSFRVIIFICVILLISGLLYFKERVGIRDQEKIEKEFQMTFEAPTFSQGERETLINSQPKELREKIEKIIQLEEKRKITAEIVSLKKEVLTLLEKERKMHRQTKIDFIAGPDGYSERTNLPSSQPQSSQTLPPGSVIDRSSLIEGYEKDLSYPTPFENKEVSPPSTIDYSSNFPN